VLVLCSLGRGKRCKLGVEASRGGRKSDRAEGGGKPKKTKKKKEPLSTQRSDVKKSPGNAKKKHRPGGLGEGAGKRGAKKRI